MSTVGRITFGGPEAQRILETDRKLQLEQKREFEVVLEVTSEIVFRVTAECAEEARETYDTLGKIISDVWLSSIILSVTEV